ncbi:hypothetical protein [Agrobacterium vitis]|uniref:hypothetical protein n=1 Tax=Agrobacterium vitis TaxID=373 RepID=UPI0018D21F81|nr:hypothetical protein [Agrobacterium vitis]
MGALLLLVVFSRKRLAELRLYPVSNQAWLYRKTRRRGTPHPVLPPEAKAILARLQKLFAILFVERENGLGQLRSILG